MSEPADPWLRHATWKRVVRHWQKRHRAGPLYCARCGELIAPPGSRSRWALDVGHVVGRQQAKAAGWTVEQANALSNTQPEHAHCGRAAGAREGNAARNTRPSRTVTSGTW